jgi:hypothetical protein
LNCSGRAPALLGLGARTKHPTDTSRYVTTRQPPASSRRASFFNQAVLPLPFFSILFIRVLFRLGDRLVEPRSLAHRRISVDSPFSSRSLSLPRLDDTFTLAATTASCRCSCHRHAIGVGLQWRRCRPSLETIPRCFIRNWKEGTGPLYHEFVYVPENTRAKQLAKHISRNGIFLQLPKLINIIAFIRRRLSVSAFELAP